MSFIIIKKLSPMDYTESIGFLFFDNILYLR
jgi:hypothetical protein